MVESKSPKKAGGEAKSRKAKRVVDTSTQEGVTASPNRISDISTGTDDSEIILKNSRLDVSLPLFFLCQIKYRDTIFYFCREMVNHCQTHLQTAMMKKRRLMIKSAKRVRKKTRWLMMRVSGHPTNPTHSKFKSVWMC